MAGADKGLSSVNATRNSSSKTSCAAFSRVANAACTASTALRRTRTSQHSTVSNQSNMMLPGPQASATHMSSSDQNEKKKKET